MLHGYFSRILLLFSKLPKDLLKICIIFIQYYSKQNVFFAHQLTEISVPINSYVYKYRSMYTILKNPVVPFVLLTKIKAIRLVLENFPFYLPPKFSLFMMSKMWHNVLIEKLINLNTGIFLGFQH